MTTENKELMKQAREELSGKWGLAIGTFLVYMLIITTVQLIPYVNVIGSILISGPMALGIMIFSLALARKEEVKFSQIFEGFQDYQRSLVAYLLVAVFVLLWTLLLIIPGIIASISYSQVFFILADDKSIRPMDALRKSKKMMDGYKVKFLCLGLRFFGLGLLCILTLGIGFLWLMPYSQVSLAKFYDDLKNNTEEIKNS